jgi:2-amino-4-hydroxy-6-hydroxymethyldihydropteridine diphosphokinase
MNNIYLLIGGNIGDRMANLATAMKWIELEIGIIQKTSSIYETAAWGNTNQPDFLNQAIYLQSPHEANLVMHKLLEIEKKMGRIRAVPMGPRTIDLDIIYFNHEIISNDLIQIPHPKLTERKFVLMPLSEIAPEFNHPILNQSNKVLLKECGDSLPVYKKTNL